MLRNRRVLKANGSENNKKLVDLVLLSDFCPEPARGFWCSSPLMSCEENGKSASISACVTAAVECAYAAVSAHSHGCRQTGNECMLALQAAKVFSKHACRSIFYDLITILKAATWRRNIFPWYLHYSYTKKHPTVARNLH